MFTTVVRGIHEKDVWIKAYVSPKPVCTFQCLHIYASYPFMTNTVILQKSQYMYSKGRPGSPVDSKVACDKIEFDTLALKQPTERGDKLKKHHQKAILQKFGNVTWLLPMICNYLLIYKCVVWTLLNCISDPDCDWNEKPPIFLVLISNPNIFSRPKLNKGTYCSNTFGEECRSFYLVPGKCFENIHVFVNMALVGSFCF